MKLDDALEFILDCIKTSRPTGFPSYGYEVYLPNVIAAYVKEVEKSKEHDNHIYGGLRMRELSPAFYEAAWYLSRHGVLRPGVKHAGAQSSGTEGDGYTVTEFGRKWIAEGRPPSLTADPSRLASQFKALAKRLGEGFLQRANEASLCHHFGAYLACCAMCGAAAESILLAVAIAKAGDEASVLKTYQASQGRRRVIDAVTTGAPPAVTGPFRSAMSLLSYWRDEAAHGVASGISEIEAHDAVARLLRLAQFSHDQWDGLTK